MAFGDIWISSFSADFVGPTFINQNPANTQSGVFEGTNIFFKVDDDISGVDLATLQVQVNVNGGGPVNAVVNGVIQAAFAGGGESIVADGLGYNVTLDPTGLFSFLDNVVVTAQADDNAANPGNDSWFFDIRTTGGLFVTSENPARTQGSVAQEALIQLSIGDTVIGVNIETLVLSIDGVPAYDGSLVDNMDPLTFNDGFLAGFQGASSSVTLNAPNLGFDLVFHKEVPFTLYDEVAVALVFGDFGSASLIDSYSFTVSEPGDLFEVRIFGAPSYSTVDFVQTGTATVDHTGTTGVLQVETVAPFRLFSSVIVQAGVDVTISQQYDLDVKLGPLSALLVYDGTTKGVEFVP